MALNMFHKCCFPNCVGQVSKSWVCSQLGLQVLLSWISADHAGEKSKQLNIPLTAENICNVSNKLYLDPKSKYKLNLQIGADLETEEINFSNKKTAADHFHTWSDQNFKDFRIEDSLGPETSYVLANLCTFKQPWHVQKSEGAIMKIHNSFTYTQDINYEARLIELPLTHEDLSTVIIVPNTADLLHTLYRRLTNEGLAAVFTSIQPIFTVTAVMKVPHVFFKSETDVTKFTEAANNQIVQYGIASIDGNGPSVRVLTCLYSTKALPNNMPKNSYDQKSKRPFFFAILFKDVPMFTGQFYTKTY